MNKSSKASYSFCRRFSRLSGSNFYLSFLLLPGEKRRAMEALYAFMRFTDDLVDADMQSHTADKPDSNDPAIIALHEQLKHWQIMLENAFAGRKFSPFSDNVSSLTLPSSMNSTAKALLPALVDTVRRYQIPVEHLFAVIDGVKMDLDLNSYKTFEDLQKYCERVASAVGLACIHIWGFRSKGQAEIDAVNSAAKQAGIALQLTNILRDIKTDAAAGRIYLPLDDIEKCGYSVEELKTGTVNEAFHRLMKLEIGRTTQCYSEGFRLLDFLQPDGRVIFGLMLTIYWKILSKIAKRPCLVFSESVRLGTAFRIALAAGWTILPRFMARLTKNKLHVESQKP